MKLLDEPTSGLDASASMEAMSALRDLLVLDMTIAAVIHQPRPEVFDLFDRVLLLATGGRTAYVGKRELAAPYFLSLGFPFSLNSNPADVLLDIVSGHVTSEKGVSHESLPNLWAEFVKSQKVSSLERQESLDEFVGSDGLVEYKSKDAPQVQEQFDDEYKVPFSGVVQSAILLFSFLVIGLGAAIGMIAGRLGFPGEAYLWVTVPFCAAFVLLFVGQLIAAIVLLVRRSSLVPLVVFCASTVFGPVAVVLAVIFSRRFYRLFLWSALGFGIWCALVLGALGAFVYMRASGYSTAFQYNIDIGASWLVFVGISFGAVTFFAALMRLRRGNALATRRGAGFVTQFALQVNKKNLFVVFCKLFRRFFGRFPSNFGLLERFFWTLFSL
jgi:hypothetical protein